jgi:2-polyprenyl-6-methoxyphenol hydroxylase-like FAD-dependent oxidoreductase
MIPCPQKIAVVGLGVAGATAATLLARQGHNVTVFEQCADPGPVGAGVLLQPSGQLVLERLGLLEQAIAKSECIDSLFARTHRGKTLVNLRYTDLPGPPAYGIHRGDLFQLLFDQLRQTTAALRLDTRAVNYQSRPTHVRLFDAAGQPLSDFDFILACDGARSQLRANSPVASRAGEYPHGALWATATCVAVRNHLLQVTHGTKHLCGILPTGPVAGPNSARCSLFWSLRTEHRDAFLQRGFDAWKSDVLALAPEAAEIFSTLKSFDQTRFTNYMHVTMPIPHDDRCLFLGDAAHAMFPHLGQGINLALIDAFTFAHCTHAADTFPDAARLYTTLRKNHIRLYSKITYLLSPFFQSRGFIKAAARNIFLPLMPKFPPLKKPMLQTMSGTRATLLGKPFQLPENPIDQGQPIAH